MERTLADSPSLSAPVIETADGRQQDGRNRAVAIGGAIDVGSNSVHLLVSLLGPGWMEPLRDTSALLGLGDTVDRHGTIPDEVRNSVVDVLRQYVAVAQRSHAERMTLIGTEPLRRALNAEVLIDEIAAATGLRLRVLNEHEEAVLTFVGVTRGEPPASPLIVVDIGGGSTEISSWMPTQPLRVDSLALGSSRLTNSIVEHDPPTDDELDRLSSAAVQATTALEAIEPIAGGVPARAVFVGGTATNVARLGRLTRAALAEDRTTLAHLPLASVSTRYNVKPRRARQLAAGVAIIDALLARYGLESAEVSEASLRDGAIIAAHRFGDSWPESLVTLAGG